MAHTKREQKKLLARVSRIRGQVDAIERALVHGKDCSDVLHTIVACRGAINGLMAEVLEGHVNDHVLDPKRTPTAGQRKAVGEVVGLIRRYLK